MAKKWLTLLNKSIGILAIIILLASIIVTLSIPKEIPIIDAASVKKTLPKRSFEQSSEAYNAIGAPLMRLQFSPLSAQLPDLRKYLLYYGKNDRPDATKEQSLLHLAFTGNKTPTSIAPDEKAYILFDKSLNPPQYVFSPHNKKTPLWLEAHAQGNQISVKVSLENDEGGIIQTPAAYAQFTLPEKEFARVNGTPWEIGKWRVDGSLLARQKARWYGPDRFLEKHGGAEYSASIGKQRIDFTDGDNHYSVYVGLGDTLIWENDHWKAVKPGEESLGHPLMVVKKVDERLMAFELWDVSGKSKVTLNLLKSNEAWGPQNIQQNFKFVGARTRSQFVFEINKERMLLSPHDWLVLTDGGWKKLVTPEEIDDYVERKITGPLFVFDGIERKDDRQVLLGTLFNAARSDVQQVELPVLQGSSKGTTKIENSKEIHEESSDEDSHTPYAKNRTVIENIQEKK